MKRSGAGAIGATEAESPEAASLGAVSSLTLPATSFFSAENLEIICGLPLSKSRKSSCFRVPIGCPWRSRTTTRTSTRFTLDVNVAGTSWVVISATVLSAAVWADNGTGHAQNVSSAVRRASERILNPDNTGLILPLNGNNSEGCDADSLNSGYIQYCHCLVAMT
jgi:hypothetical protein